MNSKVKHPHGRESSFMFFPEIVSAFLCIKSIIEKWFLKHCREIIFFQWEACVHTENVISENLSGALLHQRTVCFKRQLGKSPALLVGGSLNGVFWKTMIKYLWDHWHPRLLLFQVQHRISPCWVHWVTFAALSCAQLRALQKIPAHVSAQASFPDLAVLHQGLSPLSIEGSYWFLHSLIPDASVTRKAVCKVVARGRVSPLILEQTHLSHM